MSAPANHWKLGLFVVSAAALAVLTVGILAGRALRKDTVRYTSYFDEAVSGLSTGSPVSYRGVKIGNVSEINIAPDRRHVEVRYDLGVDELTRLGLASARGRETRIRVPSELRAQVGSTGVTGSKYLQIDFFQTPTHPPPELPFDVPKNYIPSAPSTFKSLEQSVMSAADQLPALEKQVEQLLSELRGIVGEVRSQRLPEQAAITLQAATSTLIAVRNKVDQVPLVELSNDARAMIKRADATLARTDALIERVNGERGLVTSVQRASDAVGDVAGNANYLVNDLTATVRDLHITIDTVRELADALERDSDMLVKGRAKAKP